MPTRILKTWSKKSGKKLQEVENKWNETKSEALRKFGTESPSFWAYVNVVTRRKLGMKTAASIDDQIREKHFSAYIKNFPCETFLNLTTGSPSKYIQIRASAEPLEFYKLIENTNVAPPYLSVNFDTRQVCAHEGRHRAAANIDAGIKYMPVFLRFLEDDTVPKSEQNFIVHSNLDEISFLRNQYNFDLKFKVPTVNGLPTKSKLISFADISNTSSIDFPHIPFNWKWNINGGWLLPNGRRWLVNTHRLHPSFALKTLLAGKLDINQNTKYKDIDTLAFKQGYILIRYWQAPLTAPFDASTQYDTNENIRRYIIITLDLSLKMSNIKYRTLLEICKVLYKSFNKDQWFVIRNVGYKKDKDGLIGHYIENESNIMKLPYAKIYLMNAIDVG